ncbi:MAG: OmpH/Skp family outer membrane protein [Planctomycetota bacterium]|jgi:Skp family chaperone for outer membrane proteins
MRNITLLFILAVVLSAFVSTAAQAQDSGTSKVLIMDARRIIDESDEGKDFVQKLRQKMAEKEKEILDQRQKLQEELKGILEAKLSDRNQAWYEKFREAARKEVNLKAEQMLFKQEVGDKLGRAITQIIRGAQQEARVIMKERGADVVIASKMGPITIESDQEFQQEIISRRIVCARPDIDITDEVIKRMNTWYQNNKSKVNKGKPPERKIQQAGKKEGKEEKKQ